MQHQINTLAALKGAVSKLEGRQEDHRLDMHREGDSPRLATGMDQIDGLVGGGLAGNCLHEIRCEQSRDVGAAKAFLCALLSRQENRDGKIIWICDPAIRPDAGQLCPDGVAQLGLKPNRFVFVHPRDLKTAIWAAGEAARQNGIACVVFQVKGNPKMLDLAVSRKLMLRAQHGQTLFFLLRQAGSEEASSAATRWHVGPAPSLQDAIYHRGIGHMRHRLTLERNRNGQTGSWPVCWNPSQGLFDHAAYKAPPTYHRNSSDPSSDRPDRPPTLGQVVGFERAS